MEYVLAIVAVVTWTVVGFIRFITNLEGQGPKPWYKYISKGPLVWVIVIFYGT